MWVKGGITRYTYGKEIKADRQRQILMVKEKHAIVISRPFMQECS